MRCSKKNLARVRFLVLLIGAYGRSDPRETTGHFRIGLEGLSHLTDTRLAWGSSKTQHRGISKLDGMIAAERELARGRRRYGFLLLARKFGEGSETTKIRINHIT
jgi:hypothetical protein